MYKLLCSIFLILVFASCEKEISIDIPTHTPLLVGNCLFESGRPFLVHVSNSLGSLDNAQLPVHDSAYVSLYEDGVFRELLTYMMEDPKSITRAVDLILVSRNIERIADHATNISEDVIFIVDGKNIKHHLQEENQ